jgi:hypothetical protein
MRKLLSILIISLFLNGCFPMRVNDIMPGTTISDFKEQMASANRVVSICFTEGNRVVYRDMTYGGLFYYFENGRLDHSDAGRSSLNDYDITIKNR